MHPYSTFATTLHEDDAYQKSPRLFSEVLYVELNHKFHIRLRVTYMIKRPCVRQERVCVMIES